MAAGSSPSAVRRLASTRIVARPGAAAGVFVRVFVTEAWRVLALAYGRVTGKTPPTTKRAPSDDSPARCGLASWIPRAFVACKSMTRAERMVADRALMNVLCLAFVPQLRSCCDLPAHHLEQPGTKQMALIVGQ